MMSRSTFQAGLFVAMAALLCAFAGEATGQVVCGNASVTVTATVFYGGTTHSYSDYSISCPINATTGRRDLVISLNYDPNHPLTTYITVLITPINGATEFGVISITNSTVFPSTIAIRGASPNTSLAHVDGVVRGGAVDDMVWLTELRADVVGDTRLAPGSGSYYAIDVDTVSGSALSNPSIRIGTLVGGIRVQQTGRGIFNVKVTGNLQGPINLAGTSTFPATIQNLVVDGSIAAANGNPVGITVQGSIKSLSAGELKANIDLSIPSSARGFVYSTQVTKNALTGGGTTSGNFVGSMLANQLLPDPAITSTPTTFNVAGDLNADIDVTTDIRQPFLVGGDISANKTVTAGKGFTTWATA